MLHILAHVVVGEQHHHNVVITNQTQHTKEKQFLIRICVFGY